MASITRRDLLRVGGGAAAALAVAGQAAAAPQNGPRISNIRAAKSMKLSFPSWQQDEPGSSDWWKARIADFEKAHPGVTIDFTKIGVNDIADKLLAQFAAGSPPQIVHLPYLNLFPFADKGFLEPLDTQLQSTDIPQQWSPLQQGCEWKGKTYALLLLAYGYCMIYNDQLFQKAGVTVPTDATSFVAAAKKLTKSPDQFGYGTTTLPGNNLFNHVSVFIVGNGGHVTANGKPTINSPEAVAGVSQWVDLVKSEVTPTGMDTGRLRQLLMQGKLAMWFDGPWGQGFVEQAAADVKPHLKVARMPFPKIFGGSSNVIAVPKDIPDDEKQMVWEFIKSLSTPAAQRDYVTMYCTPSVRKDVTIPPAELHQHCPLIDSWIDALNSPDLVDYFPKALATQTQPLIKMTSDTMQKLITSNASVKDELDSLQKQLEGLMQQ